MTKKNETATIRENENGTVHTVTKDHRDYMLTNHVTKNHQLKWVWVAEDGSEWTKMCGEWRRVTDRTHWYTGTVIGKEASNKWGDRAETVEPEVEETPEADVEETLEAEPEAPKTVYNEAVNETTTVSPTDLTVTVWDDKDGEGDGEEVSLRAWRGDNSRLYVILRGQVRSVTEYMGVLYLGGVWEEVTPDDVVPVFADLTPEQEAFVEDAGIGRAVVTREQADRVVSELRLSDMGAEALTAVRNAVVLHLSDLMSDAREHGDWDAFDRLSRNMSGICAVIDYRVIDLR